LLKENLEGSLFDLLKNKYNVIPSEEIKRKENPPQTSIEFVKASAKQAELLKSYFGTPLFFINTVIYDHLSKPIHIGMQYIKAERYKFILT
jgi:DNA-binding GntR family transcriptional regulator